MDGARCARATDQYLNLRVGRLFLKTPRGGLIFCRPRLPRAHAGGRPISLSSHPARAGNRIVDQIDRGTKDAVSRNPYIGSSVRQARPMAETRHDQRSIQSGPSPGLELGPPRRLSAAQGSTSLGAGKSPAHSALPPLFIIAHNWCSVDGYTLK